MTSYLASGGIQYVSITIPAGSTSATATINAVGSTAYMQSLGWEAAAASHMGNGEARVTLTNSTTITATRVSGTASSTCTVRCVVVDASSALVSSVQFGSVNLGSNASGTATISAVDSSRSVLHCLGWTFSTSGTQFRSSEVALSLSGTTVTANRGLASLASNVNFVVIEFQAAALNSNVQFYSKTWAATTGSTTQAITAVDPDKSILIWAGQLTNSISSVGISQQKAVLTNGSTVTIDVLDTGGTSNRYNFYVVEFASGVLNGPVQRGTTTMSGVSSNTSTISSVNTANTVVNYLRNNANATTDTVANVRSTVTLTDATTLTSSRSGSTSDSINSWEVFELSTGASPVTGTSAVTTDNASASATAIEIFTGTASVTTGNATASGSATVTNNVTGTASVTTALATASANAAEQFIASGSVSTANTTASASATTTVNVTGTAAVTTAPATASGAAREIFSASGAVTTANTTANGLARETFTGSVSVTTAPATASGIAREIFAGSASPTTANATASGTASERFIASGAATTDAAAAFGTGSVTNSAQTVTGTAAVTTDDATASATAFALLQGFEDVFYIPADDRTYRVPADL